MIAIVLTLIFPGLGHFYYGKYIRGSIIAGITFFPILYPLTMIGALVDIYRISRTKVSPTLSRREATLIILISILFPMIFLLTLWRYGPQVIYKTVQYVQRVDIETRNLSRIEEITDAISRYYTLHGSCPNDLLHVIGDNPLRKKWEKDAYGNSFLYVTNDSGKQCYLRSAGKDGISGTEDDILKEILGPSQESKGTGE